MAKPNSQFEKRKRDLAKKAAKDAKRQRKLEKGSSPPAPAVIEQGVPAAADPEIPEV